jgi:biotin carboxylase
MKDNSSLTILCMSSYEKGQDFMRQCKREGCRVILLTSKSLENAEWPRESIDEIFFIPDVNKEWNMRDVIYGVSFLSRTEMIDRIVALDDYDVEKAAALREHLRCPGMGDTTARYFRDKLAMRTRAYEVGIPVPDFIHVLNYQRIKDFIKRVSFPYVVKPRLQAGAHGIKKVYNEEELWKRLDELGDEQSFYLMERFVPGTIYHVDSIISENQVVFALASQYGKPPMEVAHEGRVFTSTSVKRGSEDDKSLLEINKKVLHALGLLRGVSHTEFIKSDSDGKFYFLETSARVGGANLAELVEAASGINLWAEWAKIEVGQGKRTYELPNARKDYSGIITSLAKQEWPDLSTYNDPEVVWRMNRKYHAGLIVSSPSYERIQSLVENYSQRYYNDFFTSQPLPDKPTA